MKIRRSADGAVFEGPETSKLPEGFEVMPETTATTAKAKAVEFPSLLGNVKRTVTDVPTMAGLAAGMIPGAGLGRAILRPTLAAGATEAITGDPIKAASSAIGVAGGQVLGGLARGATRIGKAALDKTADLTMKAIGKAVPAFEGKTAAEVVNRIIGGDGLRAASKEYGDEFRALVKRITGEEFKGGEVPDSARQMMRQIAPKEMAELDSQYFKAQTLAEWVTDAFKGGLMPETGKIAAKPLQEALLTQRAKVRQALPDVEQLLRMPPEQAARDVAATGLLKSVGGHVSPYGGISGYIKKLPHAPQLTGEGMTPELAAQAARALGEVGIGTALEPITRGGK